MSVRWISHIWQSSPYKGERLLLHLALADFASDEGICWPSQGTLARKARCSKNWVRLSIGQMVRDGLVEIVEPAGAGRGKVGVYQLLYNAEKGHTGDALSSVIGHTVRRDRSHSDTSDTYLLNRHEPSNSRADFDRVWSVYPRKVSKEAAWRSWQKLLASSEMPPIDTLVTSIERYASTITEMRYCAHLATWLSSQRWLDETTPVTTVPVRSDPRIEAARSHGAALARTRVSESDLLDSMTHRPPDEQAAALDLFREISAQHQSRSL
jgi:Helix-turn-helix domain